MKKYSALIFLLIAIFILPSCGDYKDCNFSVETTLGIGFLQVDDGEEIDSILPALTLFALDKPDTLLFYHTSARQIRFPLNPHETHSRFFIQPDSTLSQGDTLDLQYTPDLHFVSAGCGFANYFTLDTVFSTNHYIDSVIIKYKEIETSDVTNIKIYY